MDLVEFIQLRNIAAFDHFSIGEGSRINFEKWKRDGFERDLIIVKKVNLAVKDDRTSEI